jgi:hypothetical protein
MRMQFNNDDSPARESQSSWVRVSKPKEAKAGPFLIHFLGCTSAGWQTGLKRKIELIRGHPVFEDGSGSPQLALLCRACASKDSTIDILPSTPRLSPS